MMLPALAFRNLWRNRRRTLLTLSALVVSSSLLMLCLGVFSGMLADMLASATEQYYGHLLISRQGYQEDRDQFKNMDAYEKILVSATAWPQVVSASPRLRAFGLLSQKQRTYPAELLGIRPEKEQRITSFAQNMIAGRYLSGKNRKGIVLGQGLAEKLGVVPGDELVFVTQAADGSIGNDLLAVSGVFATGDSSHDNSLALVNLAWLQNVVVLPGKVHEISLKIERPLEAEKTAEAIAQTLPSEMEAVPWGELMPEMREAIASYDVSRLILVTILYLAAGLGVLNTFFMSVLERTRELGILMALGAKPSRIRALVLLETLMLGLLSLALGTGLGVAMTLYMAGKGIDLSGWITPVTYAGGTILPRLHATLEAGNIWIPGIVLLLVCLSAGYLPARRAARLQPIEAIHGK